MHDVARGRRQYGATVKHDLVRLAESESDRFHDTLLAAASQLFDDGDDREHWCSVIAVCGNACDVAAAFALRAYAAADLQRPAPRLSSGKARKLRDLLRSKKTVNLKPKSQREVWETLSQDRLTRWPDWIRYVRCVERRNAIVHEARLPSGRRPDRADAVEALEVTGSLIAHLDAVMQGDRLVRRAR